MLKQKITPKPANKKLIALGIMDMSVFKIIVVKARINQHKAAVNFRKSLFSASTSEKTLNKTVKLKIIRYITVSESAIITF